MFVGMGTRTTTRNKLPGTLSSQWLQYNTLGSLKRLNSVCPNVFGRKLSPGRGSIPLTPYHLKRLNRLLKPALQLRESCLKLFKLPHRLG